MTYGHDEVGKVQQPKGGMELQMTVGWWDGGKGDGAADEDGCAAAWISGTTERRSGDERFYKNVVR